MTGWQPDGRGVTPAGDRGAAWSPAGLVHEARFRNSQVPCGLIIVSVYPAGMGMNVPGPPWQVTTATTHMACYDLDNPWGTEQWSACRYTKAPHPYRALPAAAKAARHIAEAYAAGRMMPDLTGWSGETFRIAS